MSNRLEFPTPVRRPDADAAPRMLHETARGELLQVLSITADHPETQALAREGVLPGSRLRVLDNDARGTVLVQCRTRCLILGRRFTYRVRVGRLPDAPPPAGQLLPGPGADRPQDV